jgi:hypothetical protein
MSQRKTTNKYKERPRELHKLFYCQVIVNYDQQDKELSQVQLFIVNVCLHHSF